MRSPGPDSLSVTEEALLHGQFGGWSTGGGSGSSSSSCPNSPGGVSVPSSPVSTSYALTLTPTHIHVQRLSPRTGKQSRLLLPLAELTGCSCPRSPAPPLLVLYWYPPGRRRKGVSRHRQVRAYLAESRAEAEIWNAAIQCLLRGMDVSSTTGGCVGFPCRCKWFIWCLSVFPYWMLRCCHCETFDSFYKCGHSTQMMLLGTLAGLCLQIIHVLKFAI